MVQNVNRTVSQVIAATIVNIMRTVASLPNTEEERIERERAEADIRQLNQVRQGLQAQTTATSKAKGTARGDARMQRDIQQGMAARVAYEKFRSRKRAEATRLAHMASRAEDQAERDRAWHEEHDQTLRRRDFREQDTFSGETVTIQASDAINPAIATEWSPPPVRNFDP